MKVTHHPARKLPWCVDLRPVGGGRKFFETEAAAKAAAKASDRDRLKIGSEWADLPASERVLVVRVLREMEEQGVTLDAVWSAFKAHQLAAKKPSPALADAVAQLILAKRAANLRKVYVDGLEDYLNAFARGRERMPIGSITAQAVREWFDLRREAPASQASNIGRLSALFTFGVKRGWIASNPVDAIERPRLESKPVHVLSVRESAKVLVWAKRRRPDILAFLVLGLLVGCRPGEAKGTRWDDIDLTDGTLSVAAAASKRRNRRVVHLTAQAVAWLRLAKALGSVLPVSSATIRRRLRECSAIIHRNGWPQDVLRHSAASYLLALWQDTGRVCAELGTSERMLFRHYRAVVTRRDAERWANLTPRRREGG